jgi:2-dehydropantoate 2-reductase
VQQDPWPRIAVLGAGAVGCYFGGMLARAGAPVTFIGRTPHVEAITRHGLYIDTLQFKEQIHAEASTEVSAARGAQMILLCVKTVATVEAARSLLPHLSPGALVLSLQNGVDNVERIRSNTPIEAIPVAVYVAAEMSAPGRVKHTGRGDLILGDLPGGARDEPRQRQLESIAALFARAGVPCSVSRNIEGELWTKMIINCTYNAISALGRARYHRLAGNPWTRALMIKTIEEAVAVARAAGVRLPDVDQVEVGLDIANTMANAMSSTAQDLARGKRTEIDSLNGYLVRRGAELGVATPVNQTLHALVKLLEEQVTNRQ